MSQDDIISMLMDETFQSNESSSRIVTNSDVDFNIMTKISRLPVTSLQAQKNSSGILEFNILGKSLHIPQEHLNSKHAAPLASVFGRLLNQKLDRLMVVSSTSSVWLFIWDSSEDVEEQEIHKIFSTNLAKAA